VDALDIGRVCLRRWYVCLPLIILALVAGYSYSKSRPYTYSGIGGVAVVPPKLITTTLSGGATQTTNPADQNPLYQAGGTGLLQQALVSDLSSSTSQRELTSAGSDVIFTVSLPPYSSIVTVTATGSDENAVRSTVERVLAAAPQRLRSIQESSGAPDNSMFGTTVVTPAQITNIAPPSKVKLIGAFGIVGVLVGTALSVLVDRRSQRRKPPTPTVLSAAPPVSPSSGAARSDSSSHVANRASETPRSVSHLR
jgi:hypothetical protein